MPRSNCSLSSSWSTTALVKLSRNRIILICLINKLRMHQSKSLLRMKESCHKKLRKLLQISKTPKQLIGSKELKICRGFSISLSFIISQG